VLSAIRETQETQVDENPAIQSNTPINLINSITTPAPTHRETPIFIVEKVAQFRFN
jgi:hypothetical protein